MWASAGQLARVPVQQLQRTFGEEDGVMLHNMAHGRDGEAVKARTLTKSIGCGKTFTAHLQLKDPAKVRWCNTLAVTLACNSRHSCAPRPCWCMHGIVITATVAMCCVPPILPSGRPNFHA